VLYVSLGTAFNDRADFYRACLEAFAGGGPVAIAVGERVRVDDLGPAPANVDVRPWFPQPAVLRSASAFVSHAGMGSTMEALYYGVPLVCVPQMPEQDVNAARVAEMGLGVRLARTPRSASCGPRSTGSAATARSVPRSTGCARPSGARRGRRRGRRDRSPPGHLTALYSGAVVSGS